MGKPRERRQTGEQDLFRSRLDQIINMKHELVRLAQAIDWSVLEARFGTVYSDGAGMPPLPTRLMAGLAILKHTFNLSDEALCERWVENPYFQYLCGEEFFRHELSFDRSSMTRWRHRMGEERIGGALAGEPGRGSQDRRDEAAGYAAGDRGHDRSTEERHVPDGCQAYSPGARTAGAAGEENGARSAPNLYSGR